MMRLFAALFFAIALGMPVAWALDEWRLCWQHGQCYESEPER